MPVAWSLPVAAAASVAASRWPLLRLARRCRSARAVRTRWAAGINVDLLAAVRASRAALPFLRASAFASILHMSSIAALRPRASGAPYAAVKAALSQYTGSQALALAPQRIRVNAIAPGSIEFPDGLWDRRSREKPAVYQSTLARIPFGRFGTPEEIAHAALFLASPWAGWITGQTLVVDGGQMLNG
jgi:3-oxoacyl-[acyl-carrier protein] reductase